MTIRKNEHWATAPNDTRDHLYFDAGRNTYRRLCHRAPINGFELLRSGGRDRCRLCQNIRGLIPTRRNLRTKGAFAK